MSAAYTWLFCTCGHPVDEHRTDGKCRAKDAHGYPCECRTVETDEPDRAEVQ